MLSSIHSRLAIVDQLYTAQIYEIEKKGATTYLTVGYIAGGQWVQDANGDIVAPEPDKYMKITLREKGESYYISAIQATDPRHLDVDVQQLLTPEALQPLADSIDDASASPWGGGKGPGDTVWMGVVDDSGLAVSFIQSIYHEFGSGVVLPDTGIVWQNRGAAFSLDPQHLLALAPGKQPFHTLNPAAARLNDGRVMVYGSMGGDGQPQTQAALFTRYILQGVPLQESISRPRWLLGRTWGQSSDSLKLEGRFAPACIARLRELGHDVEVLADFSEAMGHAGAIVRHPNGLLEGATDPRSNGAAAGY